MEEADMGSSKDRSLWLDSFSVLAGIMIVAPGCSTAGDDHDGFTTEEWAVVKEMQPLATEAPRNLYNNRDLDPSVARLAQKLFYETEFAEAITVDNNWAGKKGETGKMSCASCHDPKGYFVDTRVDPTTNSRVALSNGLGVPGKRQTPGMLNDGYQTWIGWAGRNDSLMMHGAGVSVFVSSQLTLAHYVYRKYLDEYNTLFPSSPLDPALDPAAPDAARFPPSGKPRANAMAPLGPFDMMDPADQKIIFKFMSNMARLWDTYPRALTTHGSRFEKYAIGDFTALSTAEKRGLRLFINKAACNDCHNGPTLTDNLFHNVAVTQPQGVIDQGRMPDMGAARTNIYSGSGEYSDDRAAGQLKLDSLPAMAGPEMEGQFRTPTLLNIAETWPYFHTGQSRTLEEVVDHYNKGGEETGFSGSKDPKLKPLGLTPGDVSDLVAFLKSLTGVVDESLTKDIR
jgi:cytochrome c peroxidase